MKISALILLFSAFALTAAASPVDRDIEFVRAINNADPAARGEALLKLAETGKYPAELALIHLTRAKLPPKSPARLLPIARSRSGELVPAVLLMRAFRAETDDAAPEPVPLAELFDLVHAAWKKAAVRDLSPFEQRLFRELSGDVLTLAWECGETALLFPEVMRRIEARGENWSLDFPYTKLMEFCYRHAFAKEGFELHSEKWSDDNAPGRRAFAAMLRDSEKRVPRTAAAAADRINFLISIGEGRAAVLIAAERLDGSDYSANARLELLKKDIALLVDTMINSGRHDIYDNVRPLIPLLNAKIDTSAVKAATLINGGKYREALEVLPQIASAEPRKRLELSCRIALGEFDAAAALAKDPGSPLPKRLRILALLELAELRRDKSAFDAATQLAGSGIDTDVFYANSFGYVALLVGADRELAEKRIRFALSVRPRCSAYLDSLAWARYRAGDYAGAWKHMEEALRNCDPLPESCELLAHAGAIRLALGDREGARRYCEAALKLAQAGENRPKREVRFRGYVTEIRKMLEQMK